MSTRYLWDKCEIAKVPKEMTKTQYDLSNYTSSGTSGYVYLATSIVINSDNTASLSGDIKSYNTDNVPNGVTFISGVSAETYKYLSTVKKASVEEYIESSGAGYWSVARSGYNVTVEAFSNPGSGGIAPSGPLPFTVHYLGDAKGSKIGLVSSAASNTYPSNGESGGFWYESKGSDSIDPLSVTYSTNEPDRGETVTAIVEPQATQGGEFSWQQATLPTDSACMGVAYGNGKFISPAYGGGTYTHSVDGDTWANGTMPSMYFEDIAFGGNKFLAVARSKTNPESKLAAYTTDGTSWAETAIPESNEYEWRSVAYGGGRFVVVSFGTEKSGAAYTADGINWGSSLLPSAGSWRVAYGAGKFVAVKYNSNSVACSTDGTAWSSATLPVTANWIAIAYGAGKFVVVSTNSDVCAYSADGDTWAITTLPSSASWSSIAFGGEKFVVASTGKTAQSENGVDWDETQTPENILSGIVGYGDGKFVILPRTNSTKALYSSETEPTPGTISYLYQYSTNGGQTWTSVGNATTNTQKEVTVPESAEQFMVRVRAQDDIGFTSTDYVAGSNLEVQIMRLWVGVDNVAHKGKKLWVGVDGVARRAVRAWVGDENGTARRWF